MPGGRYDAERGEEVSCPAEGGKLLRAPREASEGWAVGQFQVHRWGYERAEGSKCPEHMGATGRHRDPDLKGAQDRLPQ